MIKYIGMNFLIAAGLYSVIVIFDTLQGTSPNETMLNKKVLLQLMGSEDYLIIIAYFLPVIIYLYTRKGSS